MRSRNPLDQFPFRLRAGEWNVAGFRSASAIDVERGVIRLEAGLVTDADFMDWLDPSEALASAQTIRMDLWLDRFDAGRSLVAVVELLDCHVVAWEGPNDLGPDTVEHVIEWLELSCSVPTASPSSTARGVTSATSRRC